MGIMVYSFLIIGNAGSISSTVGRVARPEMSCWGCPGCSAWHLGKKTISSVAQGLCLLMPALLHYQGAPG